MINISVVVTGATIGTIGTSVYNARRHAVSNSVSIGEARSRGAIVPRTTTIVEYSRRVGRV
jgi:hypothetical protein